MASRTLSALLALCALPAFAADGAKSTAASGAGLAPDVITSQLAKDWPTFNGDYSGRRFSPLSQINQSNVSKLTLAWVLQPHSPELKSMPLEVNGILYLTTPDNVWAADARTGKTIWHYLRQSTGDHIGQRGVGMLRRLALLRNARLPPRLPQRQRRLRPLGYRTGRRQARLLRHHGAAHRSQSRHRRRLRRRHRHPRLPRIRRSRNRQSAVEVEHRTQPGEPGSETWPQGTDAIAHGGGMTWMTGTYDPQLNQLYWGIGNPNPVLNGDIRKGDNLYTCSIVSLNPDTGKLIWHFQPSPHDTHDWDAVQTPVLFDDDYKGVHRKLLAQASRNGYFFVLDRTTGEHVLTAPFIGTNWAQGIAPNGQPIPNPAKEPKPDGSLVSPGSDGAANWMAPTFNPDTHLFYVSARRLWSIFYMTADGKPEGWAGRDRNLWANSVLEAIDYNTGGIKWKHEIGDGEGVAGMLSTAGNLLFTADNSSNLLALDPATGKTLWHVNLGAGMASAPMTYELDGQQYLLTPAGGVLLAWRLPAE